MSQRAQIVAGALNAFNSLGDIINDGIYIETDVTVVAGGDNVTTEVEHELRYALLAEMTEANSETDDTETTSAKILFLGAELSATPKRNDGFRLSVGGDKFKLDDILIDPVGATVTATAIRA